ncbi:MAG: hypothetical protein AAGI52_08405 [Bacteroidota bacterium]
MPCGPHIHDDPCALLRAQRKMRRALLRFGVASMGVGIGAPALALTVGGGLWIPVVAGTLLTIHAALTIRRLAKLRRRVWRVAVSSRHVVALDAGRRQMAVSWSAVERVEVDDAGLTLVARGVEGLPFRLHIRRHFAPYVTLAHELVARAERRRCAIWVNGRPWQLLDVSALLPRRGPALQGEA